ncbi:glycosyltransferase family 61 protein [Sphingomonas bacterium]|uniref:glycosyltransferase family 61 protein n=1 Tax=Sphingomonas bacterium TaxID=1895847 RepID=UPI0015750539|nr:glycosyltransferase family 61 protein [Sphingomonas bacterium]
MNADGVAPLAHEAERFGYVCCAADLTYGSAALPSDLADAHGWAEADPAMLGIAPVATLFPTARYRWRFPEGGIVRPTAFTQELLQFYAGIATRDCPASVLVRLTDAVLADSVLYARASTTPTIVYETYRSNDRHAVRRASRADIDGADRACFADPNWQCLFIGSAGSFNYGHWLVDDLPRLKAMATMRRLDARPVRVVIQGYGSDIDRVREESIRSLLGAATHIDLLERDRAYHFAELYYPTPVSLHPVQKLPPALDQAAHAALEQAIGGDPDPGSPTLLYVGRAAGYGRGIVNADMVAEMMRDYGFTTIDPDGMSFVDQVRLFAGAQVVVGQMGAAMTNTMFCRPTTTLVYLAPTGWIEPFYWDLSVVRGHYYRVLFGKVTDDTVPPHRSDFTIDPDALRDALDAL